MIVRTKKNRNYSVINNTVLRDERLSWRARGIAAYLLSMPDDWEINHEYLWKHGIEGRDAVLAAMKELEDYGYLVRTRYQKDDGKFTTDVVLHEEPQPTTDFQKSVNQNSVYQVSVNQDSRISTVLPSTKNQILTEDDDDNARVRVDAAVMKAWSENIPGTMTPILAEKLHDLTDECGAPSVIHGIVTSVEAGARNFKYIAACARNHAQGNEPPSRNEPSYRRPKRKTGYSDGPTEERKKYSIYNSY